MRAIRTLTLWVGALFLATAGAAGCSEDVCDPCPANAQGEPLCNGAEGTYYGELSGLGGDCGDASMLDGNVRVEVMGITASTDDKDKPITTLEITLTDEEGNNTRFLGTICDKTQDKAPFTYPFTVLYEESLDINGIQLRNTLSGDFSDENGDEVPESITANYSVSYVDTNNPDASCSMQARLVTTPDE